MAKITYEQLDHDAVAEGLHEGIVWTRRHRNLLIGLGIGLLAVLVGAFLVTKRNASQRVAVNALLGSALSAAARVQTSEDADLRAQSLTELETSVKALNEQYAGNPLATEGLFLLGNAYYRADDFAKAQDYYSQYVSKASDGEAKARGEIAMGYAAENESFIKTAQGSAEQVQKLEQALGHYETALQLAPAKGYLHYYALLSKARMLELTAKPDEAIAIYEQILADRPAETSQATEKTEGDLTGILQMFREQINERESQLSFAATARLRLDRLTATEQVASPQISTPQPAAEAAAPAGEAVGAPAP